MTVRYLVSRAARRVALLFTPDSVEHKGMILPGRHLRLGRSEFSDDEGFLSSGQAEADRLVQRFGLTASTRLLDIGCGPGRLAIGVLSRFKNFQHYRGIDIVKKRIDWCQRHITRHHPGFQFIYLNLQNLRYNPTGKSIGGDFRLPFADGEFDIIYLWSVFSNMTTEDVRAYLREFPRLLAPGGGVFLTAFLEDGVPEMTVNPGDYGANWKGPLHCVRYNREFFESLVAENDLKIDHMDDTREANGQRLLYLSKTESG